MTTDINAAADELYGLPARDFTAARDRLAAEVRKAGDRDLAAAIKKLRRPTATAWFANQLVRQSPDQVADLLDTGVALRRAQADLDVDELRQQTQEGQRLVTELAQQARRLAGEAGQALSDETGRELEETLHAGLVDPAASDAIRSGRLTTALHYSGFGLPDGTDPDGTDADGTGPAATEPPASLPPVTTVPPKDARRQSTGPELEAARQARRDAEAELVAARRQAGEAGRRVDQSRKRQDMLRQRIRRLEGELEQLRTEEAEAGDAVAAAARDRRAADDRVVHAEDALDQLGPLRPSAGRVPRPAGHGQGPDRGPEAEGADGQPDDRDGPGR